MDQAILTWRDDISYRMPVQSDEIENFINFYLSTHTSSITIFLFLNKYYFLIIVQYAVTVHIDYLNHANCEREN